MNKEISEKRIKREISILQSSELQNKIIKINKDDYSVHITFQGSDLCNLLDGQIEFNIIFGTDFPYKSPKAFCLTQFSTPNLADGRDLIDDLLGQSWIPSFKIIDIISKIPEFINDYIKNLQNGQLILHGSYHLGEKYDLTFLESLPVFLRKVKEKIIVNDKEKEIERWLMVSDLYLLLFDEDKWSRFNLTLVFWTNLKSLVTIRKNIKEDLVKFYFKQKHRKNTYELALKFDDSDILIGSIIKTLEVLGITFKIKKQGPPKSGKLPSIDIDGVENLIKMHETIVEERPDFTSVNYIMDLYQKAIEYYSATNDIKYEYYLVKVRSILNCPKMQSFLQDNKKIIKSPHQNLSIDHKDNKNLVEAISDDNKEEIMKNDLKEEVKQSNETPSQVLSGVIIDQNETNEFLSKLTNDQDEEDDEESD